MKKWKFSLAGGILALFLLAVMAPVKVMAGGSTSQIVRVYVFMKDNNGSMIKTSALPSDGGLNLSVGENTEAVEYDAFDTDTLVYKVYSADSIAVGTVISVSNVTLPSGYTTNNSSGVYSVTFTEEDYAKAQSDEGCSINIYIYVHKTDEDISLKKNYKMEVEDMTDPLNAKVSVVDGNGAEVSSSCYTVDSSLYYTYNDDAVPTLRMKVTVTGKNGYTGTLESDCIVSEADLSAATVTVENATYTGEALTPTVNVSYGDFSLNELEGTGYTVTYSNNTKPGVAKVKITGDSEHFTGSVTATFNILPAKTTISSLASTSKGVKLTWKKVTGATGYYIYRKTGSGKYTKVKTITKASTVSWMDTGAKTNAQKYRYKIYAYKKSGTKVLKSAASKAKVTYYVKMVTLSSAKNSASKKVLVKWKKNAKATGYQIQYSTSSKFTSSMTKTTTVKKAATVKKTISGLTKGKTYYVRVRAYKTVSGKKYYSAWSSKKSVKISK